MNFEDSVNILCEAVKREVGKRPFKAWERIPLTSLAHVALMKSYRLVDVLERKAAGQLVELAEVTENLIDLVAYAAKLYQRVYEEVYGKVKPDATDVDRTV